jgi:uncharacterized protein YbaR (Trm112 family)
LAAALLPAHPKLPTTTTTLPAEVSRHLHTDTKTAAVLPIVPALKEEQSEVSARHLWASLACPECRTCLQDSTTNRHSTPPQPPDSLLDRLRVPQATADHILDRQCLSLAACPVCLRLEVRLAWERRHQVSLRPWLTRLLTSRGDGSDSGTPWTGYMASYMCIRMNCERFWVWVVCIARRFCYIQKTGERLQNGRWR